MTKHEFEARLGRSINEEDYKIIEFVYTFHPSISEYNGKDQIVSLYDIGGMRLIRDMTATAKKAQSYEDAIRATRTQLEMLEDEFKAFKRAKL